MTPEEILRKVGLNGKLLREYVTKKLLTADKATHGSVIGEVVDYLEKTVRIPPDLSTQIANGLLTELYALVPESIRTRNIMAKLSGKLSVKQQDAAAEFFDSFKELAQAFVRKPLEYVEDSKVLIIEDPRLLKLQDNVADSFETLLSSVNKLKEIPDTKLESIYEDFNPYKTNPAVNSLNEYLDNANAKVTQYVDDIVLPEGFTTGDVTPPGMSFMGSEVPTEKLITGPFDDMISFTAAQELKPFINPELAEKAAKILESSQEIGEQIVSSAKKLTNDAIRISGKAAGALDPGDVVLSRAIPKLLTALGVGSLSSGALTLYAIYEGALILADAVDGLEEAVTNMDDNESIKDFGKDFWQGFTDDSLSEKYSLSYKLTEPIHNRLFGNVYDTMAETPMTPVTAGGGGGRAKIL
tara:strand:+ start:1326 stop:2561 length:1236 start_codon:yes stop_codon:yes gene_type:complete